MSTPEQDIEEKIAELEAEDRHVTEVINAARKRVTPEHHQTFAGDEEDDLEDVDHNITPA